MKIPTKLPLFWKFTIAIVGTIVLFGSINLYFLNYSVYSLFEQELTRHGVSTGKSIAERSIDNILYDDLAVLNKIVSENKSIDPDISYVFILDKHNQVLAHSFDEKVPEQIRSANILARGDLERTVLLESSPNPKNVILDIAVPILDGNLGTVRIGLFEKNFFDSIKGTYRMFLIIIGVFLVIGILGALLFSYVITNPLNIINSKAEFLSLDNIDVGIDFKRSLINSPVHRIKNLFKMEDEIDVLSQNFYDMVIRLQGTYAELQKAQHSLFQSDKMSSIGVLVAGICHEVRNPVAGIKNCIWRLKKRPNDIAQNIEYLDLMDSSIQSLDTVVSRLLDFSRQQEFQFQSVAVLPMIEKSVLLIAFELERGGISITKDFPKIMSRVRASSNHIEQVLLNLLLNCLDAIEDRKLLNIKFNGIIRFSIVEELSQVLIKIKDNGIGVPEEKIKYLFDPFFTMKKSNEGTGLGLSICYSIINAHGGNIFFENNEDNGVCVTVVLPKWLD
jgi:two-component system, NtrC family, sensor kinase